MDNKEFAKDLETRTRRFGVDIIRLCLTLPSTPEGRVVRTQLTKSGTSIGANYREANRARSKADFRSKIGICASEAGETGYWLEIVRELGWTRAEALQGIQKECDELLAIFSAIRKSTK